MLISSPADVRPAAARPPWREAGLLAVWLLLTLAWRPLMLPDEGRYAGVAFEMLASGDPWLPRLAGLPFFHKPPLLYWLDIAAMRVFGVGEFAARVGPAVAAWVLGMALFLHLRRQAGTAQARLALLLLATTPLYFVGGQYVNHDMGVAACITAAVLALVRAVDAPVTPAAPAGAGATAERSSPAAASAPALRWLLLGWALCGLGVLAKGLIGIVLPALIVLPWLAMQRRWRSALGLLHPAGWLAFAAVVLPWMVSMQVRHAGFFDYFIVEQHFRRFAGTRFNNLEPAWFYLLVLPLLVLPWSAGAWAAWQRRAPGAGLYLWWLVVVVGFFSLPASKLVGYVMPALAPAIALLAPGWAPWPRRWQVLGGLAALLCLGLVGALGARAPGSQRDLGRTLAGLWSPGDHLVHVDHYFYDLGFYAGLAAPPIVLSDWDDPEIPHWDNWRKELADAARFDPAAGRDVLWSWRRLPEIGCAPGRWWLVALPEDLPGVQDLPGLTLVQRGRHASLLRIDPRDCGAATPSAR